jgi:hypothetical protein
MIAALGFKRGTRIYLAGAHMYGGEEKMTRLKYLYPNIVTKEDLLTAEELQPFRNHSSQVNTYQTSPGSAFATGHICYCALQLGNAPRVLTMSFSAVGSTGLLSFRMGGCIRHD